MKRLTMNDPQGNVETAHNLFYAKDTEVWVHGGGAAPDYADITLYDFIRQIVQSLGPMSIDTSVPDEELGEELCELLFDGTDTIEGLVATLYTAAWAFADLRNRLASYEDTGLEPAEIEIANKVIVSAFNLAANSGTDMLIGRLKEIIRAESEGRLLVLPCKVGDTVYVLVKEGKIKKYIVSGIIVDHNNLWIDTREIDNPYGGGLLNALQFGVDVFLTYGEAKAALKQEVES